MRIYPQKKKEFNEIANIISRGFLTYFLLVMVCSNIFPVYGQTSTPSQYSTLYTELDTKLTNFESQLDQDWNKQRYPVVFGSELGNANSNQGERLLAPTSLNGIKLILDRLQQLNIQGVKIAINYPLLMPTFNRNQEYLAFYKTVTQEVRNRNMKLLITQGPIFRDFSALDVNGYYNSFEQYKEGRKYMTQLIINELKPDYMTVTMEPTSQALATASGLTELALPEKQVEMINYILANFDTGNTKVGAGIGTWENISYVRDYYVNIPSLDYIDIHIYPINNDYLEKTLLIADLAHAHNKRVTISEAWLYKSSDTEINLGATYKSIYGRDPYSFWQPLDQKFLRLYSKLAHYKQIEFASTFWMVYLFGYIDYTDQTRALTDDQRFALSQQVSLTNIISNQFSSTGIFYKNIIMNLKGDLDNNGRVDAEDVRIVLQKWGRVANTADVDNNGTLNSIDYTSMTINWISQK